MAKIETSVVSVTSVVNPFLAGQSRSGGGRIDFADFLFLARLSFSPNQPPDPKGQIDQEDPVELFVGIEIEPHEQVIEIVKDDERETDQEGEQSVVKSEKGEDFQHYPAGEEDPDQVGVEIPSSKHFLLPGRERPRIEIGFPGAAWGKRPDFPLGASRPSDDLPAFGK